MQNDNSLELIKAQIELKRLELKELEVLEVQERFKQAQAKLERQREREKEQAEQNRVFQLFFLLIAGLTLSAVSPEIETIIGRPLTCLLTATAAYLLGKRK